MLNLYDSKVINISSFGVIFRSIAKIRNNDKQIHLNTISVSEGITLQNKVQ